MKAKSFEIRLNPETLVRMGDGYRLRRAIADQVKWCLDVEADPKDEGGYEVDRARHLVIRFDPEDGPGVEPLLRAPAGADSNASGCHPGCARWLPKVSGENGPD